MTGKSCTPKTNRLARGSLVNAEKVHTMSRHPRSAMPLNDGQQCQRVGWRDWRTAKGLLTNFLEQLINPIRLDYESRKYETLKCGLDAPYFYLRTESVSA
jgi:hypothetical protein